MKLRPANKEANRRFHELPEATRAEALERWYEEIAAPSATLVTDFTRVPIDASGASVVLSETERTDLRQSADRLNFVMTRLNMTGQPEFEDRIKELALLRFEYLLALGDTDYTQDPKLVVDFLTKRGRSDLCRVVLARMGEEAIRSNLTAEAVIEHPLFEQHLGTDAVVYRLRARLHSLVTDERQEKEQAAATLFSEGFDLIGCDFNRWYKSETDYEVRRGDKPYVVDDAETAWLADFVKSPNERSVVANESSEPEPEAEERQRFECSKEGIQVLHTAITEDVAKKKQESDFRWTEAVAALTVDHEELQLRADNSVDEEVWDLLWGGQFVRLAGEIRSGDRDSTAMKGLDRIRDLLVQEQNREGFDPIFGQNCLAMLVVGGLLMWDLDAVQADLDRVEFQSYRSAGKLRAAVTLAWHFLNRPDQHEEPDEFEPPHPYLLSLVMKFGDELADNPSAARHLKIAGSSAETQLDAGDREVLGAVSNLKRVELLYKQLGLESELKGRFLEIFRKGFEEDTRFISLRSEVRSVVFLIQDDLFRRYVDDDALTETLGTLAEETLARRNEFNPEEPAPGASKLVLTMCQNSVLQPFLQSKLDISAMVNDMIDDVVPEDYYLVSEPYSLRHTGDISHGTSEAIEAYIQADSLREYVDPPRMQRLVAYLLALQSEFGVGTFTAVHSLVIDVVGEQSDPNYQKPEFLPNRELGVGEQQMQFLCAVYEREGRLGGLNREVAGTAVTNVIFRGTYGEPGKFYPRLDKIMGFLDCPVAELLPTEGLGYDTVKEFHILREFLQE